MLHSNGIRNYVAATKPYFSTRDIRRRLEWARVHQSWNEEQWDTAIFGDETSVTVRLKKNVNSCGGKQGEGYKTPNLVPSFKSGYVGISVCGAFSAVERTKLVLIDGTLNKKSTRIYWEKIYYICYRAL